MGTIFSRVKLSGKHVAALLALMLLSAVTAMLLPTALASMIDIGVAGENRNTILIIAAVMATLAILGCLFNMAARCCPPRCPLNLPLICGVRYSIRCKIFPPLKWSGLAPLV